MQTLQREQLEAEWKNFDAFVFVGALGICVRTIAPMVEDKHFDPAVVCVDSFGQWVVPVLSGHVGGANQLANRLADNIGGQAVVTTQSDNAGLWALDLLSQKYNWVTEKLPRERMNHLIACFVNRQPTALILEWDDAGTRYLLDTCPPHVDIFHSYSDFQESHRSYALSMLVSCFKHDDVSLHFYPRGMHLGIGCQKDTPSSAADQLVGEIQQHGLALESIASVATIELKRNEPMVIRLQELLPEAQFWIYSPEELAAVDVPNPSPRVREVTGTSSVAEAAAQKHGTLVLQKQKGCCQGRYYTYAVAQQQPQGHIEIVGAGPGASDLISVRGRRFLESADLILYAGSLVPRELTTCAKPSATVRSSADMTLEEQFSLMKEFYDKGLLIVRLHTGDPCIYGAIEEQMARFDACSMDYHITPGISSFLAAAAELRSQFTIPERCQTIILTRGEGRTSVPERERLQQLATHRSTMCIFLSATLASQVQKELLEGGYPPETPVAVCHKLTWPEQRIFRGKLCELARIVEENKLTLTTMIVVGEAIDNRRGVSQLYDKGFTHLYRSAK